MIIKKVKLKESNIEGLGVFADENIKKGELVCDYESNLAKKFEVKFLEPVTNHQNSDDCGKEILGSNSIDFLRASSISLISFFLSLDRKFVNFVIIVFAKR